MMSKVGTQYLLQSVQTRNLNVPLFYVIITYQTLLSQIHDHRSAFAFIPYKVD